MLVESSVTGFQRMTPWGEEYCICYSDMKRAKRKASVKGLQTPNLKQSFNTKHSNSRNKEHEHLGYKCTNVFYHLLKKIKKNLKNGKILWNFNPDKNKGELDFMSYKNGHCHQKYIPICFISHFLRD